MTNFAINKGCELILKGMPSGACQLENQNFDPHTPFSSSQSQGYTQMREPRSDSTVEQHLKRIRHGYHAYAWTRDMFPEWHAEFGGHQTNTLDKYHVPVVVIPAVKNSTTPHDQWYHAYQVKEPLKAYCRRKRNLVLFISRQRRRPVHW